MMKKYSYEFKARAVEKALGRDPDVSLGSVTIHLGVDHSTLRRWVNQFENQSCGEHIMNEEKSPQSWTAEQKLQIVIACESMDEGQAKADGSFNKLLDRLGRVGVLIIDDWGLEKITAPQRYDLMEIMDDRYGENSTVMISQLPVSEWHGTIGDNTVADAILDRIVHNSHRLELGGESMRKTKETEEKGGSSLGEKKRTFCSLFDREIPDVLKSVLRKKKKGFYCPFILGITVPLFSE